MKSNRLHDVVLLKSQGLSRRAIARTLSISRKTVNKLLHEHEQRRDTETLATAGLAKRRRGSKLDSHRERLADLLKTYPDITAQRIFEELTGHGFDGGYTIVKDWLRAHRPAPSPVISLPVDEPQPGDIAESDWATYLLRYTHAPSERLQCFAYVLRYSRRKFFHFFERYDLYALMQGHVLAFERFGGLAAKCKYDGQKTVITGWEGGQPLFNLRFIDFATHYELKPLACRPRKPNDKPRVERAFWELEKSFFNGRSFRDRVDLDRQLTGWMDRVADNRGRSRGQVTPLQRFELEKPELKPLPAHPYDTARVVYRVCDVEGYVAWDGNRYSLPYEHVTEILPLRITGNELFVYAADLSLVARHELRPRGGNEVVTEPSHRPRRARSGATLEQLRHAFAELGEAPASYLAGIERTHRRSAAYHARSVLALRERYKTSELTRAMKRALDYGAFDHASVKRILEAQSEPRRLDEYVAEALAAKLDDNSAGTVPRDLAEYDRLPTSSAPRVDEGDTLICQVPQEPPKTPISGSE